MARDYSYNRTWRFDQALGDTVMEKYESLYVFLMGLQNDTGPIKTVVASRSLAEMFSIHSVFSPDPLVDGVKWPPDFTPPNRTCYRVGRIHDFDVVIDHNLPEGNMYVIGDQGMRKVEVPDWMN